MKTLKKIWILLLAVVIIALSIIIFHDRDFLFSSGQNALGIFAAGNFAAGIFAAGNFSIGIFSIGIFSIGIFSLSLFNIALYGTGIFVLAWRKRKLAVLSN